MKNLNIRSISDIQSYFNNLYAPLNSERDWQEIYGYLARTSGYLTRSIIKGNVKPQDFSRPISWLFGLANKLDIDIQESFFRKYPGICPYCIEKKCCCLKTNKKPKVHRQAWKIVEERDEQFVIVSKFKKMSLNGAAENLQDIYQSNEVIWHFSGPWMNCSKLFEEVAELHEVVSKYLIGEKVQRAVEEEFADVLAWILSSWSCQYKDLSIDDEIKEYFYNDCPVCLQNPCCCGTNDSRIQGIVDIEKFKTLRVLFEELEKVSPDAERDVRELVVSLKSVEDNQDETTAAAAATEAKTTYNKLVDYLDKTDTVSKKLASISKVIDTITQYF